MENFDPVGIHTGDSIVIAPAVTLSDREYQMLRSAALKIVSALGVEGGCNCQFALNPNSFEYAVIEVNPRVSRSSALASKATGYPIAKVATKIAIGYRLDEIRNSITGTTYAAFEPALDYVTVKIPRWPFDKFVYAKRNLGTQMKATGEVMAIADCFEAALLKAVRGLELSSDTLNIPKISQMPTGTLLQGIREANDERLFMIYEAIRRKITVDEIFELSRIDRWFLYKIENLVQFENKIRNRKISFDEYVAAKKLGYTDAAIRKITGYEPDYHVSPVYKMVDTCAGEFEAQTPYFYSGYNLPETGGENEAETEVPDDRKTVVVLGSGPIRIGQGIEFDYAAVHCANALRKLGYRVVIINNNPETVSTDFDMSDRLYFEPLYPEDVLHVIEQENPVGVVVAFGGQTAIKLTKTLKNKGINIIGTCATA